MAHRRARAARWFPLACILALPSMAADGPADPPPPGSQTLAALGPEPAAEPAPSPLHVLTVRRGDTLARLLASAGIEAAEAEPALDALTGLFPARSLQPGDALTLRLAQKGEEDRLLGLELMPEPGRVIRVSRGPEGWMAEEERAPEHRHLVLARGEVRGALVANLQEAGLPPALAIGLARLLAHEIDFQRDLRPGDRFSVLFERFRDPDGALLRDGEVVHVELLLSDRRIAAWRHETPAGPDWFDDEGRSLRRAFLRTPLDGARLSSAFGMREHPILGFTRMHHGVDFAAPAGTPVYAAADGVVVEAGVRQGYGRLVRLRHGGGTETLYAHLSGLARGLRPGRSVRQGEVIGRVGATGWATGPHLHYEVRRAGRPVDPATAAPGTATARLEGRELVAFLNARRALLAQMARLAPMQEIAWAE